MLHNLPEELLEHILSRLHLSVHPQDNAENRDNRRALLALIRVSKFLCPIVRPHLYRACADIDDRNIDLFLRTLIVTRPLNSKVVKQVRIGHAQSSPCASNSQIGLDTLKQSLQKRCSNLGLSTTLRNQLANESEENSLALKAGLILALCLGLESLMLHIELWGISTLIPKLLEDLAAQNHQKLLDFGYHSTHRAYNWEDSAPVSCSWQFDYLEAFRGFGIVMMGNADSFTFNSFKLPALKSVTFEDSIVDSDGVSTILKACPKLEGLSIHWGDLVGIDEFWPDYEQMGNAIRTNGLYLQRLSLDIREAMYNEFHDFSEGSSFGSLAELAHLQTLRLPFPLLLGDPSGIQTSICSALVYAVPASLQYLDLLAWPDSLDPFQSLRDILEFRHLNRLKVILLETRQCSSTLSSRPGWKIVRRTTYLEFQRTDDEQSSSSSVRTLRMA